MSNSEILEAAIKKAWTKGEAFVDVVGRVTINYGDGSQNGLWQSIGDLVFSHKFAKAFWGEDEQINTGIPGHSVCVHIQDLWEYHLQQMVLEEDPIQYLKQFL